jgi:hypothetical protein
VRLTKTTITRTLAALAGMLAIAASATAGTITVQGGSQVIAQNGFGERENSYAWSMGWFDGKLYVGTGRDVLCVEDETTQFYVPLEQKYTTNPSLNVHCPVNPFEMNLRAEIWQYTPGERKWRMVYHAPTERNPAEPKLPVASDIAYRSMVDYQPSGGRQAIYAAGVSADEFIPQLLKTHPPRIMRSYDGVHWEALNLPDVVVHYPFGDKRPMGFRQLLVWKHHLYVTATPDLTGDGSLFEITSPWSKHPGLVQISPPNLDVFEVATLDGKLFLGCGNEATGYSVWEASGHDQPFIPIVTGGAGRGAEITSVVSMHVFHGSLYVGASGWYQNTLPQSEMIRIAPNGQWTLVVGEPRKLPSGQIAYPTSGLGDGFNSLFNAHFWRMAEFDGGLYIGTNSWAELLKSYKTKAWVSDIVSSSAGYQLWATCDGEDYVPVTRDAFGAGEYNFGARTLETSGPGGSEMYIGSADHAAGTNIINFRDSVCSSLLGGPVAAPSAMIAENAKHGTLLSWKRSPSAKRYEVLAANELKVTLYMQPQPTAPSSSPHQYPYEGAQPILAEPEAPGSVPVTLSVAGEYETVGSTTGSDFVAPTKAHRIYEVVAENAAGVASSPSNVQVFPTPEPAATFGSVRASLPAVGGSGAHAASAASDTPQAHALDTAERAWDRGERATALAELRRLEAAPGGGADQLSALALRLERALLYADAAGGP